MCLSGDMLFYFAVFIDEFDGTISKANCEDIAGAFGEGHPIVVNGVGVKIQPFGSLCSVDVPFIDDIVISDAEQRWMVPCEFIEGAPRDGGAHVLMFSLCLKASNFESHRANLNYL